MKTEPESSHIKRNNSPTNSPRSKPHNISNISNNASAIGEDDGLIKDRQKNKLTSIVTDVSPIKFTLDSASQLTQKRRPSKLHNDSLMPRIHMPAMPKPISSILKSRVVEVSILGLIAIYTLLVLVTVLLDDGSDNSKPVIKALNILKYVELGILIVFIIEILLKVWAMGLQAYFKDAWYIVDAVIILITLALVIVDIVLADKSISGLNRVRGLFRLFRIFLLLRKANEVSRIRRNKVRTSGFDIKSPAEKVLELLETFKANTHDKAIKKEIDWAIEIVSTNRLYEPIFDSKDDGNGEKTDVNQWLKSYNNNPQAVKKGSTNDLDDKGYARRRSTLHATVILHPTVKGNNTLKIPQTALTVLAQDLDQIHFDVVEFKKQTRGNELPYIMLYLFDRHNFFENLNINQETFTKFVKKVHAGYLPNPYHNSTHAADVVQTTNYILTTGELLEKSKMSNIEVASLLIAGAIHDYDHPGTNNLFQIGTGSVYAIRYNDKAVLENHHVSTVFAMLQNENYNIFANFSKDDYKMARERIIAIVLATDMSNHFADIAKLKGRIAADLDLVEKDKKFMMELVVHAADISNPSKPWDICKEWTMRVVTEFWDQGDKERELGIPVSHLCDRYTTNLAKSQIGFIDFVTAPLFGLIKEILPKIDISNLEINKAKWKDLVDFYESELKALNEKKNRIEESKDTSP